MKGKGVPEAFSKAFPVLFAAGVPKKKRK